jgi:hypothetical protein
VEGQVPVRQAVGDAVFGRFRACERSGASGAIGAGCAAHVAWALGPANASSRLPWNHAIPAARAWVTALAADFGPGIGSGCPCLQPPTAVRATTPRLNTQNALIDKLPLPWAPLLHRGDRESRPRYPRDACSASPLPFDNATLAWPSALKGALDEAVHFSRKLLDGLKHRLARGRHSI